MQIAVSPEWANIQEEARQIQLEFERAIAVAWRDEYDIFPERRRKVDQAEARRQQKVAALTARAAVEQDAVLDRAARAIEGEAAKEAKRVREALASGNQVHASLLERELAALPSAELARRAQSAPAGFERDFSLRVGRLILQQRAAAEPGELAHQIALVILTPQESPAVAEAKTTWRLAESWRFEELDQVAHATSIADKLGVTVFSQNIVTADHAHASLAAVERGQRVDQPPILTEVSS